MAKGTRIVAKKKRWVQIRAPKLFNHQVIGESYVGDAQELLNRKVSVSLMVLIGDPQKQTVHVKFHISKIEEGVAHTDLIGYRIIPTALKKLVRRNRSKIDDSFIVETSDKKLIRIKPLSVTRGRTSNSVSTAMRKLQRAVVAKFVASNSFDSIITDIVQKKLQHALSQILRRLHPVGISEIRQLELIPPAKAKEVGLNIILPPEKLPEFAEQRLQRKPVRREVPKEKIEKPVEPPAEKPVEVKKESATSEKQEAPPEAEKSA